MKKILILFLLLLFGLSAKAQQEMDLYLLIGQSNMAGRGKLGDEPLVLDSIYMLDRNNKWVQAVEPIHFDKPVAGAGLGASFATEVREPGSIVGLIPCAVGGSPIESWMPDVVDESTGKTIYNDAVDRTREALKWGKLKGILWHQGESDSNHDKYKAYEDQFEALLTNLSHDLCINIDSIPIVTGELGYFFILKGSLDKKNQGLYINSVHHHLAQKAPNRYCVSAAELTHIGDSTHFDTASLRQLGKRYAEGYKIVKKRMEKCVSPKE